jgi:hypothetical protein
MENFSKRTTATLVAAFLLAMLGWGFTIEKISQPTTPVMHCDHHQLTFSPAGKA